MISRLAALLAAAGLAALCAGAAAQEQKPAELRIGIVAPGGTAAIAGAGQIRRAFNHATGLTVKLFAARDMVSLVEAHAAGRVDYAIYSAAGYAAARAACGCVEPLAAPRGSDGDTGVRAVVYARAGAARTLEDASGLRIVAGPHAAGPQLLALDALEAAGAGGDVVLSDRLEDAEKAFAEGRADILLGWEPDMPASVEAPAGTAARLASLGVGAGGFTALWRSDVVRYGPHAVRADLPAPVKDSLRTFLRHVLDQQPVVYDLLERRHLGGFAAVADEDYAAAAAIVALAAD